MALLKGIAFPFRKREDGLPGMTIPPELYRDSILQILLTEQLERVMRPAFGVRLKRYLFENLQDKLVQERVRLEVQQAINRWEPRVTLIEVSLEIIEEQGPLCSGFIVNVIYRTPDGTDQIHIPYVTPRQPDFVPTDKTEEACP